MNHRISQASVLFAHLLQSYSMSQKTIVLERVLRESSNRDLPVQICNIVTRRPNPQMLKQGNTVKD